MRKTRILKKGEVIYLGYRCEMEANVYAIRPADGMPPIPLGRKIAELLTTATTDVKPEAEEPMPTDINIFIVRAAGHAQFLSDALNDASEPFTLEALCELSDRAEQLHADLETSIDLTIDEEDDSL